MNEENQEAGVKAARLVVETYNAMAKKHGWPQRIDTESITRNRKLLSAILKGLEKIPEDSCRDTPTLIGWVLSRWNWNKSPAPLSLAGSDSQWSALRLSLSRESEELAETLKGQLERVATWTEKELQRHRSAGLSGTQAKKETESFARASGKLSGWNPKEVAKFKEMLERETDA